MKIATGSDWRDGIPFETPVVVSEVVPGEPTRCAVCGVDSAPRPRTELWAFKHRHPKNHDGYVRFYCREHVPAAKRPEPVLEMRRAPSRSTPTRSAPRASSSSRPAASDVVRAMCPNCFVEVSATGLCGICGEQI
jgi:hypothetical protein